MIKKEIIIFVVAALAFWGCGGSAKAGDDTDAGDGTDTPDVSDTTPPDVPDGTDTVVPDGTDTVDAPDSTGTCGDGTTGSSEKCDDSNLINNDGCNPTCDLWGTVTTRAGNPGVTGSADGTGAAATFQTPAGIATDGTSIFVADAGNCIIRQVDIATWAVTRLAGAPGSCGHADGNSAQFDVQQDVEVIGAYVYVADTNNHVIRQIEISTGNTSTVAGAAGSSGLTDGVGSAARLNEPRGLATDGTVLFVADFGNHAVRRIDLTTWDVTTIAGGTLGSADGTGVVAQFNYPRGIGYGGGYLYVGDTNNQTVRQVDPSTGAVLTIAGSPGAAGFADGVGGAARFNSPRGIAVDAESVYVADNGNELIRQILIGSWDVSSLCGQNGAAGSTDGTGSAARHGGPWGLVFDPSLTQPSQILYVASAGNHTIRTIE